MHSVLLASPFLPICISRPKAAKHFRINFSPLIRLALEPKTKAPSSMYRNTRSLKVRPDLKFLGVCP
eukprot:scaffold48269_cov95-Cyclotella_meneghiniana.AAC.1